MSMDKFWLNLLAGVRNAITSAINDYDGRDACTSTLTNTGPGPAPDPSTVQKLPVETVDQLSNELLGNGAVLDSEGLPWDDRIHSSGKTFYKKDTARAKGGSWKLKKGVSDAVIEAVCAELRASHPAPGGGSADAPLAPGAIVETVPLAPGAPTRPIPPGPGPAGTVIPPGSTVIDGQVIPPIPPEPITSWSGLLEASTKAGFTHEMVTAECVKYGVADLFALQDTPALIPTVAKGLGL